MGAKVYNREYPSQQQTQRCKILRQKTAEKDRKRDRDREKASMQYKCSLFSSSGVALLYLNSEPTAWHWVIRKDYFSPA